MLQFTVSPVSQVVRMWNKVQDVGQEFGFISVMFKFLKNGKLLELMLFDRDRYCYRLLY